MKTAWLVTYSGGPIEKPGSMQGLMTAYHTKGGVPVFYEEEDAKRLASNLAIPEKAVIAPIGMVGIDLRGQKLYAVLAGGECYMLNDFSESAEVQHLVMQHIDQIMGEVVIDVASQD